MKVRELRLKAAVTTELSRGLALKEMVVLTLESGGTFPAQFGPVDQLLSVPPPSQMKPAARRPGDGEIAVAKIAARVRAERERRDGFFMDVLG